MGVASRRTFLHRHEPLSHAAIHEPRGEYNTSHAKESTVIGFDLSKPVRSQVQSKTAIFHRLGFLPAGPKVHAHEVISRPTELTRPAILKRVAGSNVKLFTVRFLGKISHDKRILKKVRLSNG